MYRTSDSLRDHSNSPKVGWLQGNVLDPAANAVFIEPYNAVAGTINAVGQELFKETFLPKAVPLAVEEAKFGSTQWLVQSVSGGLATAIPYAIAGKFAGCALAGAGENLALKGVAASFCKNEIAAQVIGAGVYDGMRDTRPGETRFGNAVAGAASFAVFGIGNHSFQHVSGSAQLFSRLTIGALGATTQTFVSDGISRHRLPTQAELTQSAISGSVMNVALPTVHQTLGKAVDQVNLKIGRGLTLDRYIATNDEVANAVRKSPQLQELLKESPWTRIQTGAEANKASGKMIFLETGLKAPNTAPVLAHELEHLRGQKAYGSDPLLEQSRQLLGSDRERAWQLFQDARINHEIQARMKEYAVTQHSSLSTEKFDAQAARQSLPKQEAAPGLTYEQLWKKQFDDFESSNGAQFPAEDYKGRGRRSSRPRRPAGTEEPTSKDRSEQSGDNLSETTIQQPKDRNPNTGGTDSLSPANNKIPRPANLLANGEGEGDIYDNRNGTVTKIYYDRSVDAAQKRAMYERLESIGITVPKIFDHGTTADGQPALVIEKVGDGDNLKFQLVTGELSTADRESLRRQYYEMGDTLERNGISVDWNLGNMRFENGKLYLLDPSFIKESPMPSFFVDMFGRSLGPRA